MAERKKSTIRGRPVPEKKKLKVKEIEAKVKNSRTILIASTKSLPAANFQRIKKNLRGKAEIIVAKKSIILRALGSVEKGAIQNLKNLIIENTCLIFSDLDSYEVAGLLIENQISSKAKAGDTAPEDIDIEPGPTDLVPGPAISELGSVGLKVAVENGKLSIKNALTIVKKGDKVNDKVSSVLGKLKILPMKVGFIPLAAYDSKDDMLYEEIKIDKKGALEELRSSISKALGFAVGIGYTVKETISFLIAKASMHEKAIEKIHAEKSKSDDSVKSGGGSQ